MKSWIAKTNPIKNKNILMLDLEQVLIVDSNILLNRSHWKKEDNKFYLECCQLRNYSKEFVFEVDKIFDKVYMNTCVSKNNTNKIM